MSKPYTELLPYRGYQDNPVLIKALTYFDEFVKSQRDFLQSFYLQLHPDTCEDKYLDLLAYLVGFSGEFWDAGWTPEIKRTLITNAHPRIWPERGRLDLIYWLIGVLGLDVLPWSSQPLVLPLKLPSKFGSHAYKVFLRVPFHYSRGMKLWNDVERLRRNYLPATTLSRTVYTTFKLGYSKVGEPVFKV